MRWPMPLRAARRRQLPAGHGQKHQGETAQPDERLVGKDGSTGIQRRLLCNRRRWQRTTTSAFINLTIVRM